MSAPRPPSNSDAAGPRGQHPVASASAERAEHISIEVCKDYGDSSVCVGTAEPAQPPAGHWLLTVWASCLVNYLTHCVPRARGTPAFLVSLIFHISLLILLALLSWTGQGGAIRSFDLASSAYIVSGKRSISARIACAV